MKKPNTYPFTWLDELAEVVLNPEKTNAGNISQEDLQAIRDQLPAEFARVSASLKSQAFCLYRTDQVKVVAGHYDQAIRLLQQQMQINLLQFPASGMLRETGEELLAGLQDLYQSVQQRYEGYLDNPQPAEAILTPVVKVLCRLSVDQIAIILKAADDIQLVVTRSFSQLLKNLVPFLSTERFENFSWKSTRSSIYKMEGSDKQVVIKVLEALIDKVREY